ncbi:MAG: CAP domain-containing protein [Cyanobacteria bacterium P01_G01_bin.39]
MANQFESQVYQLTNQERSRYSLRHLLWNDQLYAAAINHSRDMARIRRMSHTGSNGSNISYRVKAQRYRYSMVAENVAAGQLTPQHVVSSWMRSPGHRQNILNPNLTEIGVGYCDGYWTQVFGKR